VTRPNEDIPLPEDSMASSADAVGLEKICEGRALFGIIPERRVILGERKDPELLLRFEPVINLETLD
jgi:hypothetical protein